MSLGVNSIDVKAANVTKDGVTTILKQINVNGVQVWKKSQPYSVTLGASELNKWSYVQEPRTYTHRYSLGINSYFNCIDMGLWRNSAVFEQPACTIKASYPTQGCAFCTITIMLSGSGSNISVNGQPSSESNYRLYTIPCDTVSNLDIRILFTSYDANGGHAYLESLSFHD